MHYVLDMSLRTRYVLRTRKIGEYHIETDRSFAEQIGRLYRICRKANISSEAYRQTESLLWTQKQCLQRKEDRERQTFSVLFLSVGVIFYWISELSFRVRTFLFLLFFISQIYPRYTPIQYEIISAVDLCRPRVFR